jgi:hypothetical protein
VDAPGNACPAVVTEHDLPCRASFDPAFQGRPAFCHLLWAARLFFFPAAALSGRACRQAAFLLPALSVQAPAVPVSFLLSLPLSVPHLFENFSIFVQFPGLPSCSKKTLR